MHRAQQQAIALGLKARDETAGATTAFDYVDELIKGSSQAWSDYIEHPFPKQLANDTALLNGFRHYMIVSGNITLSDCTVLNLTHSKIPYTLSITIG